MFDFEFIKYSSLGTGFWDAGECQEGDFVP